MRDRKRMKYWQLLKLAAQQQLHDDRVYLLESPERDGKANPINAQVPVFEMSIANGYQIPYYTEEM